MRLALFSFLPEDLVSSLEKIGIRTDADLLFSSVTADILRRLPPGIVTLQDLKHYMAQITDKSSALGVRGDILLALECEKQEQALDSVGSGVKDLDALLNGFGGPRVFELSGEKAAGKTVGCLFLGESVFTLQVYIQALAMHLVLRHLVNNPHSGALWMDTAGDFSAERVAKLLQFHDGAVCNYLLELFSCC
jgi:RAD51-like protein 3